MKALVCPVISGFEPYREAVATAITTLAGAEGGDPNAGTGGTASAATAGIATAFDGIAESLWMGEAP